MSFRYFILGLLTRQPMSGYDVKRFLRHLDWLIDSPSFGSVYPALHTLLKDKLVTVEVIPNRDRPARKVYTITEAGRQVLQEWLDQPLEPDVSLKAFLMRLMLATNLPYAEVVECLQQRRSQVATHRASLKQVIGTEDEKLGLGQRLAFDYGLAAAQAELAWLDRMLKDAVSGGLPEQMYRGDNPNPTA
jgi:PadR family transcriptional regulator AphA